MAELKLHSRPWDLAESGKGRGEGVEQRGMHCKLWRRRKGGWCHGGAASQGDVHMPRQHV
jgi:hypothetical protein